MLGRKSKEGYFYYFTLLELIGEQCDKDPDIEHRIHTSTLREMWGTNAQGVHHVCTSLAQSALVVCELCNGYVVLRVPNFSKYLGKYKSEIASNGPNKKKRKEIKIKENKETNKENFEAVQSKPVGLKPEAVFQVWNEISNTTKKIPSAKTLSASRSQKIQVIIRTMSEMQNVSDWENYFKKITATPFLIGQNNRSWRADFDWAITSSNLIKVAEGRYDSLGQQSFFVGNPYGN